MSSGPKPFNSWPHGGGGWVGGCGPALYTTTRVDQAWGISLMVPHPTSCGFGLAYQLSLCECSFHHHGLPQPKGGGGERDAPQWSGPGTAPPQNQAAGTRVVAIWDLGGGG